MGKYKIIIIVSILAIIVEIFLLQTDEKFYTTNQYNSKYFNILSSEDNKAFDSELKSFARNNKISINITYADDLEAIDLLESDSSVYDAVWMSNSTWLYMLNGVSVLNSKSININPVVFGIKKSKAKELGFIDNDVYNKDIVEAIKNKKLSYVMSSVTKTNTGLIAYLGFLNALSGSPEILTSEMLNDEKLERDLIDLFSGVERVSGTNDFLIQMFLNSNEYEAVIATESSLIGINKQLESSGKEPLYLIYPIDGVAINDSPFAYIDNNQDKLDKFNKIQSFLLSDSSQEKLEKLGKRTWYGGVKQNADKDSFKKEWGIDTTKYLIPLKYPSKSVMDEAIALYIESIRKPSATAFCLDFSGSMYGEGESELKSAMNYILNYETASKDNLQFSKKDTIFIIPFNSTVYYPITTYNGRETTELIGSINSLESGGGTNIYGCAIDAINILKSVSDDYTKTVVLMTDGESTVGSISNLTRSYGSSNIPIYSIMFGRANRNELDDIARLSNSKVFDGRDNLVTAFKEVRGYN